MVRVQEEMRPTWLAVAAMWWRVYAISLRDSMRWNYIHIFDKSRTVDFVAFEANWKLSYCLVEKTSHSNTHFSLQRRNIVALITVFEEFYCILNTEQ